MTGYKRSILEEIERLETMLFRNNFEDSDGITLYFPESAAERRIKLQALFGEPMVNTKIAPLMPADLAALALPDESLADLKVRLLTDLTRLRSMAVGRLDMTDAERAMLTTLEGQVAQQWFSS
jgi:hypothetical protein